MAEVWASLKELRIRTSDPFGFIDIQTVANKAALPSTPIAQTVYRSEADKEYLKYENNVWTHVNIEVSDEMMNGYIAQYGVTKSISKVVTLILASLGKKLQIERTDSGTESYTFTTLKNLYDYYKALRDNAKEEASDESGFSTGRFFCTCPSKVGGINQW